MIFNIYQQQSLQVCAAAILSRSTGKGAKGAAVIIVLNVTSYAMTFHVDIIIAERESELLLISSISGCKV